MSNYPPGVTADMIPGNRPEDEAWERWIKSLDPDDIADNILVGVFNNYHQGTSLLRQLHMAVVGVLEDADQEMVGNLGASLGCNPDFKLWCSGRADYERGRFDNLSE